MSCEVVPSALGSAFVCGRTEPQAPCHFCGAPSEYLCDFNVEKPTIVPITDVRVGDVVSAGGIRWDVIYHAIKGERAYYAVSRDGGAVTQRCAATWDSLTVMRTSTCDAPCCYNCVREVDEEVHYCRGSHWSLPA